MEGDDVQKEHYALTNMRLAVTEYAAQENLSFGEALVRFAQTPAYDMLFDYQTNLWMEGPRYLMVLFLESLASANSPK